jgi:hypothetical protein
MSSSAIALIHHLDVRQVRKEMVRILARDGKIILQEPIRFSRLYARLPELLPFVAIFQNTSTR